MSASSASGMPIAVHRENSLIGVVGAALIGNTLEWFDLSIYAYFALAIGKTFFPSNDPSLSLLLAFGTFGISFLIRPVGAVVLGAYADRAGRKKSLTVSLSMMLVGTLLIAVMPSYAAIGVIAPIGILLARLMQGFSAGGEFGSATAFMMEHAPKKLRSFVASLQFASQGLGVVLASLFGYFLTKNLNPSALQEWGWRIPFCFGLSIAPIGLYIRHTVDESPEFVHAHQHDRHHPETAPPSVMLRSQKLFLLIAVGIIIISTASTFLIKYIPTYAQENLQLPASSGFLATLIAGLILTGVTPVVGYFADRLGRLRIMLCAAVLYIGLAYPFFYWINAYPGKASLILVVALLSLLKAVYFAPLPSFMADIFPTSSRVTGLSLSYSIGVSVFGGFVPAICIFLIRVCATPVAPSFYLILASALSIGALLAAHFKLRIR